MCMSVLSIYGSAHVCPLCVVCTVGIAVPTPVLLSDTASQNIALMKNYSIFIFLCSTHITYLHAYTHIFASILGELSTNQTNGESDSMNLSVAYIGE